MAVKMAIDFGMYVITFTASVLEILRGRIAVPRKNPQNKMRSDTQAVERSMVSLNNACVWLVTALALRYKTRQAMWTLWELGEVLTFAIHPLLIEVLSTTPAIRIGSLYWQKIVELRERTTSIFGRSEVSSKKQWRPNAELCAYRFSVWDSWVYVNVVRDLL
jgi:hypothetical protein